MEYTYIALLVVAAVAFLFIAKALVIVPQGFAYTIERFGRYKAVATPGLTFITPFIERVAVRMNMMEQVFDIPSQTVITRDNATTVVDGVVFFRVLDASMAAYQVANLADAILNITMTNIRTVMGSMDLDELLSHREKINNALMKVVDEATDPWGVKVTRVEIKDISPPHDLVESMARQMKAEREKRALVLEAEGKRQAEVLKAEGHKRGLVLEAEGRKESAFLDAEARERAAQAEAKATEMVSAAVKEGDQQALNYFVALKYAESLKDIAAAPNQKVIFMPLEATNLIGSVGGISELLKESGVSVTGPRKK